MTQGHHKSDPGNNVSPGRRLRSSSHRRAKDVRERYPILSDTIRRHCHINRLPGVVSAGHPGHGPWRRTDPDPHHRHRFPAEIISHAVWLYHTFSLSFRDIELLLAERGICLSYETVRRWCAKFGASFADRIRRRRPRPGDKWHLDEVFVRINGILHYLWRAVDQNGVVLDILVQGRRDGEAAKRFFRRLLNGLQYVPCVIVTDKLGSYRVARRKFLPNVEHRESRYLNNRAENSHRPTRRRERHMQRFKSAGQAQRFLSAHSFIHGDFHPRRHLISARSYRKLRSNAFREWRQETCARCTG
jgi:putative transposase